MTPNRRRDFLRQASATAALGTGLARLAAASGRAAEDPACFICVTCGTQFAESIGPPPRCSICEDERQYVGPDGQQWTTLDALRAGHKNRLREHEPGLHSISVEPNVGIGQRAFLVQTTAGNVLWDCVAHLDAATVAAVRDLGGVRAIAISHPHYYTTMVEWSRAFGDAPIHLHEADRPWVMRPDPAVKYWAGEALDLPGGLRLVRTGGHFDGYQVLHWPAGAGGKGALMAGDQPQVCMDPKQVSFMYSYPNFIPLNAAAIRRVVACLDPLPFDRVYGAFVTRGKGIVPTGGKEVVRRSAERYLRAIQG